MKVKVAKKCENEQNVGSSQNSVEYPSALAQNKRINSFKSDLHDN